MYLIKWVHGCVDTGDFSLGVLLSMGGLATEKQVVHCSILSLFLLSFVFYEIKCSSKVSVLDLIKA